jgi:hypothetical protein
MQIVPADLDDAYDLAGSIPDWLGRHLTGAVVFLSMARPHPGIARALATLPWGALLCPEEFDHSAAAASEHVRVLMTPGVNVAPAASRSAAGATAPPLLLLVRGAPQPTSARRVLRS